MKRLFLISLNGIFFVLLYKCECFEVRKKTDEFSFPIYFRLLLCTKKANREEILLY